MPILQSWKVRHRGRFSHLPNVTNDGVWRGTEAILPLEADLVSKLLPTSFIYGSSLFKRCCLGATPYFLSAFTCSKSHFYLLNLINAVKKKLLLLVKGKKKKKKVTLCVLCSLPEAAQEKGRAHLLGSRHVGTLSEPELPCL